MIEEIKISKKDAEYILSEDAPFFEKAKNNAFCTNCFSETQKGVTIVDYDIYVDSQGGLVIKGSCKTCGKPVARCIESDEMPKMTERAMKIIEKRKKNPME